MNFVTSYFRELSEAFGRGWNRFWFATADPLPLGVLRIATGLIGFYFVLSYSGSLVHWFGQDGLLPPEAVWRLTGVSEQSPMRSDLAVWRLSYLHYVDTPAALRLVHGLGLGVVAMFIAGIATRATSILTLVVVLSYINRAPMLTGLMEPVLAMMLLYLCIGPAGASLSVDQWLRRRRAAGLATADSSAELPSVLANISLRLIQLHLAGFYLMMALSKLGEIPWWTGEGVWFLIARTDTRPLDLTFLHNSSYVINLWTHGIVLFELIFPLLIWNRLARPILLTVAVPMWISIALLTGLVSFSLMMLVANLAFVSPAVYRQLFQRSLTTAGSRPATDPAPRELAGSR